MKYGDAHSHLQNMTDLPNVLARADAAGVGLFVCNATHEDDWAKVLDIAKQYPNVKPSIGVHPWFMDTLTEGWEDRMGQILTNNPHVMVGEIGLDRLKPDLELQEAVLRAQLNLAHRYNRTVHIHCVRAWDAMMHVLKTSVRPKFFVSHAHHGDVKLIPYLQELGGYFSYSHLHKDILATPLDRLLVESDAPDGLPEPADIPAFVQKISATLEQDVAEQLFRNLENILC